jgi:hypothetical protein
VSDVPPPDPSPYRPDGTQPPAEAGPPSVPYPTDRGGPASPGSGAPRPSAPPGPPAYAPGHAPLPPAGPDFEPYPPTSHFPPAKEYGAQGYGPPPPGYGPPAPGPAPRKSNGPLVAVIVAVALLLCGGVATAGVLVVRNVSDKAKEAVKPITEPTFPALPTDVPNLPTDLPSLPTDVPGLPTDLPGLPGAGKDVSVTYTVKGDGPADVVYTENLGDGPKKANSVKLPWKITAKLTGALLVSVTAVRSGEDDGDISCQATVDGKTVVKKSASGPFAAVSCTKVLVG